MSGRMRYPDKKLGRSRQGVDASPGRKKSKSFRMIPIIAKHPGTCVLCGDDFPIGTYLGYRIPEQFTYHATCAKKVKW